MDPLVGEPYPAAPDTHVIPTYWPVPDAGVIPMNAFLVRSAEPLLVDTGTRALSGQFLDALGSLIDPADLRWIWLTHEDHDHSGSLRRLLEAAPRARVISTFMAIGRMMPAEPFPLDRVRLINPGETVSVGDRTLTAIRPPLFDSPATTGFVDGRSGMLFSSDCFGAPLPTYGEAAADNADDLDPQTLARSQTVWATVDSPWVTMADPASLGRALDRIRLLAPTAVLSSHLPPIRRGLDRVLGTIQAAQSADPAPGMTQKQLEAMLSQFEPART